jgi:hypothetical protein
MAKENSAGLGVSSRYGQVNVPDGAKGSYQAKGGLTYLVADWSADLINSDSRGQATLVMSNFLPTRAWVEIETATSLSAAGASISFGKQGALGTDSADVSGSAIGVGFKTCSLNGIFSTGITATCTLVVGMKSGQILNGAGRFVIEGLKA